MKFTRTSFFCLLVGVAVFLTACPFSADNEFYLYGKEIHNYPAWLVPDPYSFNLLDAEQSDFADYFTLKVAQDRKTATITYYKLKNGSPTVVRRDENLECWYQRA